MVEEPESAVQAEETRHSGLASLFQDWAGALAERVSTGATLAMAETRLAISTFLLMVFVSVLAAGAILFAWGLLVPIITAIVVYLSLGGCGPQGNANQQDAASSAEQNQAQQQAKLVERCVGAALDAGYRSGKCAYGLIDACVTTQSKKEMESA